MKWQPIESAEDTGRLRLFYNNEFNQHWVGYYQWFPNMGLGKWVDHRGFIPEQPTHWMPLPDPPEVAK